MDDSVVKTHTIKIGGREFTLAFTLSSMLAMQNCIDGFNFNDIDNLVSTPAGLLNTLYVLADTGERLSGRELDVDKEWFALHTPATMRKLLSIQIIVMNTLADGMSMEAENDNDHEVDLVLQEIQKKSEKTSLPGEKSQPGDSSQD